jgi:hypothetical protein
VYLTPLYKLIQTHGQCIEVFDAMCNRALDDTRRYAQAAAEVGAETRTATVDLFSRWTEGPEDAALWKGYLLDGLHFNERGNERFYAVLEEAIHAHFPHLHPGALKAQFPSFQDIDAEDMAASFG